MRKKLLIITDYQNDFVASDGKVAKIIGDKNFLKLQEIAPKIQKLVDFWHQKEKKVLFLVSDYNSEYHKGYYKEFRARGAYGNTVLKNTIGHELYKLKSEENDKFIVKNYFDGFYQTELETFLKENQITDIYFCGVNTDVCVFHTAIGAMNRGYNVYVIEDATETITDNKKIFLDYLREYVGVKIIESKLINNQ